MFGKSAGAVKRRGGLSSNKTHLIHSKGKITYEYRIFRVLRAAVGEIHPNVLAFEHLEHCGNGVIPVFQLAEAIYTFPFWTRAAVAEASSSKTTYALQVSPWVSSILRFM